MNRKPHILIVAPFTSLPGEGGRNRFQTLAELFARDYQCTLVTSRFQHKAKAHREGPFYFSAQAGYQIRLIDEPGYKKNVGLPRLLSHRIFCNNLQRYLRHCGVPDLVYSAYPLIGSNLILGPWCRKKGIPLIMDVQDVWPESFTSVMPSLGKRFNDVLLPLKLRANKAYQYANGLVAVSDTYCQRALEAMAIPCPHQTVYIGSDDPLIDATPACERSTDTLEVVYIGTLSYSYDMETIIEAAALLKEQPVKFTIIGDGPHRQALETLQAKKGGNLTFTGMLPYQAMISRLKSADLALNAINKGASQSITNKLSDYLAVGLPIASSQDNPEVLRLLANGASVQYEAGNPRDLTNCILSLMNDRERLSNMRHHSKALGEKYFKRSQSYKAIQVLVSKLLP